MQMQPSDRPPDIDDRSQAIEIVSNLVYQAHLAQAEFQRFTQEQIDETITAVGWTLLDPANNERLSRRAVADTGMGRVRDKITKNHRKTLGLLRDLQGVPSTGVIAEHLESGIVEIARPVGVVGALTPLTNPVATPYNMAINALKCANAVILSPSPAGNGVAEDAVALMHEALKQVGAPVNLVQKLPPPINMAVARELMQQVDLVVVTGAQINVKAAIRSGTPAFGVGAGNVTSIIDDTADIDDAVTKVMMSKTFDHSTSCSSENNLLVLAPVYDKTMAALVEQGAVRLDAADRQKLQQFMWSNGALNPAAIAQPVDEILENAGINRGDRSYTLIIVEHDSVADAGSFCDEKLSPVLNVLRVTDFAAATETARQIFDIRGSGHSISIHSTTDDHVMHLATNLPTCRVMVNQAHAVGTGGAFNNGMPFSLSMGCGTWGENVTSDNLNYRHFMNTTRISRVIPPREPSLEDIFGTYWRKYGTGPGG